MSDVILKAFPWRSNAELIADAVVPLGYIKPGDRVLDVTYGKGVWWKKYCPKIMIAHDIKIDGVDFRKLPEADGYVDVVAFDPPYVSPGGRETSTTTSFNEGYGIDVCPPTVKGLLEMNCGGVEEAYRVLAKRGKLLIKCENYVSGGNYRDEAYKLLAYAQSCGFKMLDEFVHLGTPNRQPPCRTCKGAKKVLWQGVVYECMIPCAKCDGTGVHPQSHSRANYSLLFVLQRK